MVKYIQLYGRGRAAGSRSSHSLSAGGLLEMKKLTEDEVKVLRGFRNQPDGDIKYWDKMADFYADDPDTLKRIEFERKFAESIHCIPLGYGSYDKTRQQYLDTVDEFNKEAGYTPEPKEELVPDNLMEKLAARFGIDIDVDGDGITSFEHYKNKKD